MTLKAGFQCKWSIVYLALMASSAFAQDITGSINIDQTHTGTTQTLSNVTVGDFGDNYVKDSTITVGNRTTIDLNDGLGNVKQNQTGTVSAISDLIVGKGTLVHDTGSGLGNTITLSNSSGFVGFKAKLDQANTNAVTADILLKAGEIEFYHSFLNSAGNNVLASATGFHAGIDLKQNNSAAITGKIKQTGSTTAASSQVVVAGNQQNFKSTQPVVARLPAYRY